VAAGMVVVIDVLVGAGTASRVVVAAGMAVGIDVLVGPRRAGEAARNAATGSPGFPRSASAP